MQITLSPDLEQFVARKVESGKYPSALEVINDGLRLLRESEERLEELRREIAKGIAQADRGETVDGAQVFRELHEMIRRDSGRPQ